MVLAKNGVGNIAVGDNLNGAVVVAQLLLGDYIRVVAVYMAVDADDVVHNARYGTYVVRHHHNGHVVAKVVQQVVQLVLEAVIHKVGGLVKHQELRLGDYGTAEHNALQLTAREFAYGACGEVVEVCFAECCEW